MRTLKEIREARAAKVAEARALVTTAEQASRQLTADEQGKFANLQAEITNLESDEQRQQFLDDAERRSQARPVHTPNGSDTESRVSLLAVVRAGMEGRSLTGAEAEMHAELERRHGPARNGGILVPLSAFERRANTTATAPELVATQHRADQYIGPLSDSLLVRSLGVRTLTGLTGNVSIPKAGAGLTAGWVTEGQELPESQMDFDSVTLTPKHVGGITEMSRQLIQQSSPAIEDLVRDDLSFAVASAIDRAIIAGTGANGQPLGLINRAGVQKDTIPTTWAEVLAIEQLLAAINVNPTGWYTSPDVLSALRGILKAPAAGSDYIATASRIGELAVAVSNASPANTAILGDWSQVLLGQWGAVEILVNPYAETSYRRGGVLVRAMATVDVAVRHEEAFVVATGA
ncbi:phage major capsid protein [Xanthomonas perforans]|uniref:Phage major capsid protein n=1 Tax=Xanthomonas perforans TaxID=442694 RepID=A0A6P0GW79_XANPE|nr:phage major capsid protein [Xanthomonas perforans]MBZ2603452.1 phage major capsid protein [Xanthomonas perforans]MBZ2745902.1 phage major capsid protein [Xanthomonas perforans]MBZ3073875.1 phage major capsid protein [Xanthomonas perforans]MBZ3143745.1 phage major capsid protein [Xanthomonas perforans]MBZ3151710.1 phage major capsid protein [Xanthomonas perforans]